jgi:hypothetical protein
MILSVNRVVKSLGNKNPSAAHPWDEKDFFRPGKSSLPFASEWAIIASGRGRRFTAWNLKRGTAIHEMMTMQVEKIKLGRRGIEEK